MGNNIQLYYYSVLSNNFGLLKEIISENCCTISTPVNCFFVYILAIANPLRRYDEYR